ncbi:MAG TPA: hypothetical protein VM103_01670 [Candidatus Paceibacterota bacterium]|nr:hypothetical protein [Candidatus Paceibacterota bacterium]
MTAHAEKIAHHLVVHLRKYGNEVKILNLKLVTPPKVTPLSRFKLVGTDDGPAIECLQNEVSLEDLKQQNRVTSEQAACIADIVKVEVLSFKKALMRNRRANDLTVKFPIP